MCSSPRLQCCELQHIQQMHFSKQSVGFKGLPLRHTWQVDVNKKLWVNQWKAVKDRSAQGEAKDFC